MQVIKWVKIFFLIPSVCEDMMKWALTYTTGKFVTSHKCGASKDLKYVSSFPQEILFLEIFPKEIIGDILRCLNKDVYHRDRYNVEKSVTNV